MGIAYDLSDPFTYNAYAFCNNNAWRYSDPTGEVTVLIHGIQPNEIGWSRDIVKKLYEELEFEIALDDDLNLNDHLLDGKKKFLEVTWNTPNDNVKGKGYWTYTRGINSQQIKNKLDMKIKEAEKISQKTKSKDLNIISHSLGTIITSDVLNDRRIAGNSVELDNLFMLGSPQHSAKGATGLSQSLSPFTSLEHVTNWWIFHDKGDPITQYQNNIFSKNFTGYRDIEVENYGFLISKHGFEMYIANKVVLNTVIRNIINAKKRKNKIIK